MFGLSDITGAISDAADAVNDFAGGVANGVGGAIGGGAGFVGDVASGAYDYAVAGGSFVYEGVEGVAGTAFDFVTGGAGALVDVAEGTFDFVADVVTDPAGKGKESIEAILARIADSVNLTNLAGLDGFSVLFLLMGRFETLQQENISNLALLMERKAVLDQESFKKSSGEPNNFDELSARPEFQNLDTNIALLTQRIQRVEQDMQQTKVLASQLTAKQGQANQQVINNI